MFKIDNEFVRKLAALLQETGLTDIEVAEGDKRIRVSRAATAAAPVVAVATPTAQAAAAGPAPSGNTPPPGTVTSPMVGTAYVAPEPGAAPFVKIGDAVKPGQTLLIIEAMKVMNPIKATKGGTVTHVFVSDAQPVEFGEPLIAIS